MNEQLDPVNFRLIDKAVRRESQPGPSSAYPASWPAPRWLLGKPPADLHIQ